MGVSSWDLVKIRAIKTRLPTVVLPSRGARALVALLMPWEWNRHCRMISCSHSLPGGNPAVRPSVSISPHWTVSCFTHLTTANVSQASAHSVVQRSAWWEEMGKACSFYCLQLCHTFRDKIFVLLLEFGHVFCFRNWISLFIYSIPKYSPEHDVVKLTLSQIQGVECGVVTLFNEWQVRSLL